MNEIELGKELQRIHTMLEAIVAQNSASPPDLPAKKISYITTRFHLSSRELPVGPTPQPGIFFVARYAGQEPGDLVGFVHIPELKGRNCLGAWAIPTGYGQGLNGFMRVHVSQSGSGSDHINIYANVFNDDHAAKTANAAFTLHIVYEA